MTVSITALYHYIECHHGECQILFYVMLSVIMLSFVNVNVFMLSVVGPNKKTIKISCLVFQVPSKSKVKPSYNQFCVKTLPEIWTKVENR